MIATLAERSLAGGVAFLARVDAGRRDALLASAPVRTFPSGAAVVTEGEPGDAMYVVLDGEVEVLARGPAGATLVLARLSSGAAFGEQALLPEGTGARTATVRAVGGPARLLEIGRPAFRELSRDRSVQGDLAELGAAQLHQRLAASLSHLGSIDLAGLSGRGVTEVTFGPGDVVFREGDPGDAAYFVLDGVALVARAERRVARVGPGQCFGERALLSRGPRAATVSAEGPLRVLRVDGPVFLKWYADDPALRDLVQTLSWVQVDGQEAILTVHRGTWQGHPCITSVQQRADGTRVVATKVVGSTAFAMTRTGPDQDRDEVVVYTSPTGAAPARRELRVREGTLVGVISEGPWPGLGAACHGVLGGARVEPSLLERFRGSGDLEPPAADRGDDAVVCACLRTRRRAVLEAVAAGHDTVEAVARVTGAGDVCGACSPALHELLGSADLLAVRVEAREATGNGILLRLAPVGDPLPRAVPGQYVGVRGLLPQGWVQRSYSLSDATTAGGWEILVKPEPGGLFSPWLCGLAPGALLRTGRPAGAFVLPDDADADVVFFAAGVGVSPALAMVRAQAASPRVRSLHLHYSATSEADFACATELRGLVGSLAVTFHPTATRGRLGEDEVRRLVAAHPRAWFLLCGPVAYMDALERTLRAAGVPADRIRTEAFTPVTPPVVQAEAMVAAREPPTACPGMQGLPLVGPLIGGLATVLGPLEQTARCRAEYGDVFTIRPPLNPPITYLLGAKGYGFFNDLPVETAGIGEVLQLVSVFGHWITRSDPSPAWLEALAVGGRRYVQERLLRPERVAALPAEVEEQGRHLTADWGGRMDLTDRVVGLVHAVSLRCVVGAGASDALAERALPLIRKMAQGIDVPRLPLGSTPARFLLPEYHAARSLEGVLRDFVAEPATGSGLVADLRATMVVDGRPLDERDLLWALNYVLFNACAYPGTYGFWSLVDLVTDAPTLASVRAGTPDEARTRVEHALLETIRLNPVTVAGRTLKRDLAYVEDAPEGPRAWQIPGHHLLGAAPGSFTRDPAVHAEPDRYCPHRFEREPVPALFGGGAFGCVAQHYVRTVLPTLHAGVLRDFDLAIEGPLPHRKARPALHYPRAPLYATVTRRTEGEPGPS